MPAVRQKLHLSSCADFRDRLYNVVDVSAVRDLYGTMLNEGAARGILVTTSRYGRDAHEFSANKPITLIDGQNLLSLLAKHGYKFKIELT